MAASCSASFPETSTRKETISAGILSTTIDSQVRGKKSTYTPYPGCSLHEDKASSSIIKQIIFLFTKLRIQVVFDQAFHGGDEDVAHFHAELFDDGLEERLVVVGD